MEKLHCSMYWGELCGSNEAKLTLVFPRMGEPKSNPWRLGLKLSLCWFSGKTNGTLWRCLHQVFMSTGVKKRPNPARTTNPYRPWTAWVKQSRGGKFKVLGNSR